jgi:hypothetical protein
MTVFACWLGYEMNWIRQRRTIIGYPQVQSSTYYNTEAVMLVGNSKQTVRGQESVTAPWPLPWLGESGYAGIFLGKGASEDEVAHVRLLFPEAEVGVDEP